MVHGKKERRRRIIITRYDYNLTIMKPPKPATDTIYLWNRTMLNFAVLWHPFWKWRPVEFGNVGNQFGTSLSTHISHFDDIGQCWIFTAHFYAVFWQPFWKWQTSWKFLQRRIAPLMVTYHYVKFYISIIIHLEVININVRNFNFPIGFYSNPHPIWTPQNITWTPFTTKLKTLGPTKNIYL